VFGGGLISGGSSSGSAVAVAAGLVTFSLGTDTAGSGRVPAAMNGIVGLKPTRGLIPTPGVVPACRSLDCVCVFATTVSDAGAVLAVARGFDPIDPYSRPPAPEADEWPRMLRIGVAASEQLDFFGDDAMRAGYDQAQTGYAAIAERQVTVDIAPCGSRVAGGSCPPTYRRSPDGRTRVLVTSPETT
jgi:allophanate hydrolase